MKTNLKNPQNDPFYQLHSSNQKVDKNESRKKSIIVKKEKNSVVKSVEVKNVKQIIVARPVLPTDPLLQLESLMKFLILKKIFN